MNANERNEAEKLIELVQIKLRKAMQAVKQTKLALKKLDEFLNEHRSAPWE